MAEIKKYLDTTALGHLVDNIKAEDAKALQAAKDYADSLATNYDASGAAASAQAAAEATAKDYTDAQVKALADGDVKTNTAAITAIKNGTSIDSFADVEAALAGKQATGDYATKTEAQGYANAKDEAIAAAKASGDAAQDAVDALAGKVGEVPADQTVMGIINNIQENAYDDTAIKADIKANTDAISAMDTAYKAADTTLQGNIDAVSGKVTTLVGEDTGKSVRTIANEELAAQLIADGAKESLDTLQEIAAWIQSHPDDASAMSKAIDDLEALVGTLPEDVTATTITGYVAEAVAAEKARAEEVEGDLSGRIDDLEAKFGGAEGSVEDMIADAKQEAIDAAAGDATTKANKALEDAKAYADAEDAKIEARVDALEEVDHEHKNFDLLETYTQTEENLADAVTKKHAHGNLSVLETITSELIGKWNAAEQNAKDFAQGLNDAMDSRVEALETASDTHALKTDLEAAVTRIAANETAIASNTSAINSFSAITETEVDALFA